MSCCLGVQGKGRASDAMNYFEETNNIHASNIWAVDVDFAIWICNLLN
jgi:hypothetical protein